MQGELNISSIYKFMLSVSCIEELDISSLCETVCRGSLTSPLMHCILYFTWVRVFSSLPHVMHVCRLPFHKCISHIYLYCWFIFHHFVDDWQKGGEWFWVYIYIFTIWVYVYTKRRRMIFTVYTKKREKVFGKRIFDLCMFLSPCLCIYICLVLCTSL